MRKTVKTSGIILLTTALLLIGGCTEVFSRDTWWNYAEDYLMPIYEEGAANIEAMTEFFSEKKIEGRQPWCYWDRQKEIRGEKTINGFTTKSKPAQRQGNTRKKVKEHEAEG